MSFIIATTIVHVVVTLYSRDFTVTSVAVLRWKLLSDMIMVALVVVAATLVPSNTLHRVFVKVGTGGRTLWVAAFQGTDEIGTLS